MARHRAPRLTGTLVLTITDPQGRRRTYRGHNTVTDYGLFLVMNAVFGGIAAPAMPPTGTTPAVVTLGAGTRWNDGTYVYPSLYDLGGNNGTQANPWVNTSGVSTSTTLTGATAYKGLFGGSAGLILVATNDSSSPSETQFQWPTGTQCLWTSTATTTSTTASNDSWTTAGSTSGATPPQAKWVITDTATAVQALTIQSMGWTAAFTLGSVSTSTAPTPQAAPTPAWTSTTPTTIAGWPIFSKVIPSGAPIAVASGSTMAATYIFTLTT
jgi:hypothetical protein